MTIEYNGIEYTLFNFCVINFGFLKRFNILSKPITIKVFKLYCFLNSAKDTTILLYLYVNNCL